MDLEKIRHFVNECLHNPCNHKSRIVNGFLAFVIIFSIAVIPLHFLPRLEWIHEELFFFDRFAVTIFTAEYILRIWSATKPKRYIFSWWGVIDLAAIVPFYLGKLGLWLSPEVFLMLRSVRILKFVRTHKMENLAEARGEHLRQHGDFSILPHEKVERIVHKHPLIFLLGMILPLFFTSVGLSVLIFFYNNSWGLGVGLLFFLFAAIFFSKAWLDYHYDVIYITNFRVIVQNRALFGNIKNDIAYEAITNVVPTSVGLIRWMFGMGDIHIETAANAATLFFEHSPKPNEVVRHISQNRLKVYEARELLDDREQKMMEKLQEEEAKIDKVVESLEKKNQKGES